MKKVLFAALLLMGAISAFAAKPKETHWYDVQPDQAVAVRTGDAGTVCFELTFTTNAKDLPEMKDEGMKLAVYAALFTGIGEAGGVPGMDPLVDITLATSQYNDMFQAFFENKNNFVKYISRIGDKNGMPKSTLKVKNGQQVIYYVVVKKDLLRKEFEDKGVIEKASTLGIEPVILIYPSTTWMNEHKFVFAENGMPDFEKALSDPSRPAKAMQAAISAVGTLLRGYGYQVTKLQDVMDKLKKSDAYLNAGGPAGAQAILSSIDQLDAVAKCDIKIYLTIDVVSLEGGHKRQINYKLEAIDPYTNQGIAGGLEKVGPASLTENLNELVRESVLSDIQEMAMGSAAAPGFKQYFEGLKENGRKVNLVFRIDGGSSLASEGFLTEVGDDEEPINEVIKKWMKKQSVDKKANVTFSENTGEGTIRIPLLTEDGEAVDAQDWLSSGIRKLAKKNGLKAKVMSKGLAEIEIWFVAE